MKQAHSSAPRGKKIRVVLKDGTEFVDKFIERRPSTVVFAEHVVRVGDMKSFTIYREPPVSNEQSHAKVVKALIRELTRR